LESISEAEEILGKLGLPMNFSSYFGGWKERGIDLMRPMEGKKYPGISAEDPIASGSTSPQELDLHGHQRS
jgi:hypothetical protein